MVGGSVSGKPFKADPTSYEQTGIPCGAPARYRSRGVIRLNTEDAEPYEDQRLDAPGVGTQSEAEEHLKKMVANQLDTNITLASQLQGSKRKIFTKATTYQPFCPDKTSGALSLKDYQSLEEQNQRVQTLRDVGLTEDEIQFKLEQEGLVSKAPKRSRYGANPMVDSEKNSELERRIQEKERMLAMPDTFSNVRVVSRHAMEVERSLHRGTEKALGLSHLVQVGPTGDANSALELSLAELKGIGHNRPHSSTKTNPDTAKMCEELTANKTGMSLESAAGAMKESGVSARQEELTVAKDRIQLPSDIQPVAEEEILGNKLSIEGIREIPRFRDYEPGQPSKTLYLKNLHPRVTEADLVALFIKFQRKDSPRIVFRLMKGRMKGQAFVTLPDVSTASAALELVNGYSLQGKPIIIQYGRQGAQSNQENTDTTADPSQPST